MSRNCWSKPYVQVLTSAGHWIKFDNLDSAVRFGQTPVKLVIRWRAPGTDNAFRRTVPGPGVDLQAGFDLISRLERAATEGPGRWQPDAGGLPVPPSAVDSMTPPGPPMAMPAGIRAVPEIPQDAARPVLTGTVLPPGRLPVRRRENRHERLPVVLVLPRAGDDDPEPTPLSGASNPVIMAIASGQLDLGTTVREAIEEWLGICVAGWSATHFSNVSNICSKIDAWLCYREPGPNDTPSIAEHKLARLELPGVEEFGSIHLCLVTAFDLIETILNRRFTDHRSELLNEHRHERFRRQDEKYRAFLAKQAAGLTPSGARPRPPEPLVLRQPFLKCSEATEKLFAIVLGEFMAYCDARGYLVGPNPWVRYVKLVRKKAYRRPTPLLPTDINTLNGQLLLELADAIASLGPRDAKRNLPAGERLRAPVLASVAMGRVSEMSRLEPWCYLPGKPALRFIGSQYRVWKDANDGEAVVVRNQLKTKEPGVERISELPRFVAEAIERHIELGYASGDRLFTCADGQWLDWNRIRPMFDEAVRLVLGTNPDPILRAMTPRWLRKSAITFQLAAGRPPEIVAAKAGHSVSVMLNHYAGVIYDDERRQLWTGIDDAWAWFTK